MTDQPFDCQRCRDGCPCLPGSAGCAHFGCEGNAPDDVFMSCAGVAVIQGELAEHGTQLPRTRAGARAASVLAAVGLIATAAGVAGCGQLHATVNSSGATVTVGSGQDVYGIQAGPVVPITSPARPGETVSMRPVVVHATGADDATVVLRPLRAQHLHGARRLPVSWQVVISGPVTIPHGGQGQLIMSVRVPAAAHPGRYKGLVAACQTPAAGSQVSLSTCQATNVTLRVAR